MPRISVNELAKIEKAVLRSENHKGRTVISVPYQYDSFSRGCDITRSTIQGESSGNTIMERLLEGKGLRRKHKNPLLDAARTEAQKLAKIAQKHIDGIVGIMSDAREAHLLGDSVQQLARPKSKQSNVSKAEKAINNYCKNIEGAILEIQEDQKIQLYDILPEITEKTSPKSRRIIERIQEKLEPLETEDGISLSDLNKTLGSLNLERTGRHGRVINKLIKRNLNQQKTQMVRNFFKKVAYEQGGIKEIGKNIRDQIGIRFVIKPMPEKLKTKIQQLPEEKRIEAVKKYMDNKVTRLLDMLIEQSEINDIQIVRMRNYSGRTPEGKATSYASPAELERMELAVKDLRREDQSTKSGYPCLQLNLVKKEGKETVRMEVQIRGEEVQKIGEAEHFVYDPREGKKPDLSKYPQQKHTTILKIDSEARKLAKNPKLDKAYSEYLSNYYYYAFAKEHGVETTAPKLPEGINPILAMEVLLKMVH